MMTAWLRGIIELPRPLVPGDKVADEDGKMVHVYEVHKLVMRSMPIAARARPLFAVFHAGAGSIFVAVCLADDGHDVAQSEWCCERSKETPR